MERANQMKGGNLMRYRLLGKSGVRISEVALGTMTFGEDWGWGASPAVSARMLDLFADAGGNVIDTADVYTNGTSETILGELQPPQENRHLDRGEHASIADRPYRPVLGARPRRPHSSRGAYACPG
jgi:hypothetical protein